MRKGFTLVELLVVTLVIAILAGIVFRIAGTSKNNDSMRITVQNMQRVENCLSGYYAAFGSYPPVEVHGSRNPFYPINEYGIAQVEKEEPNYSSLNWSWVEAACRSQPMAMMMPYSKGTGRDGVVGVYELLQALIREDPAYAVFANDPVLSQPFDGGSPGALSGKLDLTEWTDAQIFKFGLMSFLLPRYLLMLGGEKDEDPALNLSGGVGEDLGYYRFAQWGTKNNCPCRFDTGVQYDGWKDVYQSVKQDSQNRWEIELIPSQTICQRWIANLEETCTCGNKQDDLYVFGVDIKSKRGGGGYPDAGSPASLKKKIYSAGDSQAGAGTSGAQQYCLNCITVEDGWGNEFYYYSPPPYQTYRLWSSGPNGQTFPPWIADEQIRTDPNLQQHAKMIYEWISDDVVHLSN